MSKLSNKQIRFCEEYLVDLNATQAAIRAGYSQHTAGSIGEENLKKPDIDARIKALQAERSKRTEITVDMVLQRWWAIANADANELSELRRRCCRYCHGEGHEYQWTEREFKKAQERYLESLKEDDFADEDEEFASEPLAPPDPKGGFGWDPRLEPHPDCPECFGEGVPDIVFKDTGKASPAARLLYAGVKQTNSGLEIKTHDQMKALDNVARHLGMFKDKDNSPSAVTIQVTRFSDADDPPST
ncbi:terminase small subunit [Methylobacterium sp. 1030]|uniref:terminase small subunit n=1 Tax=Methylobacterium sp. 1030 TaxID=3156404 RepID=UPI003399AFCB